MEAQNSHGQASDRILQWMRGVPWSDPEQAELLVKRMQILTESSDHAVAFYQILSQQLSRAFDADLSLARILQFFEASDDHEFWLGLFSKNSDALSALQQLMEMSETIANRIIADPQTFSWIIETSGEPKSREELITDLSEQLEEVDQLNRASNLLRQFYVRHTTRVAYAEFITGLSPEKVGRYLSAIADSMIEVGLQFVMKRLIARRGEPQRPDGTVAEVAVIGLGNLGGNEMSYNSPLKLVFLYDSIDNHNVWHRDFYSTLVDELVGLLRGDPTHFRALM